MFNAYNYTNNSYGIYMLAPVPRNYPAMLPVQRIGVTLFYLQLCICLNDSYYLNMSNYMCELCSDIPYCTNCLSDIHCILCIIGYETNSSYLCE